MKDYLAEIVSRKRLEVENSKLQVSLEELSQKPNYSRKCFSLRNQFEQHVGPGIIAEFKRSSPSLGSINKDADLADVVLGYQRAGAFAVSVLTDEIGFGGTLGDLELARSALNIPILRKEFIVDEYQIHESKAYGADVILLIAACLTSAEVKKFCKIAHEVGLEVLLEVHGVEELSHLCPEVDILGVNNRNLKTFEVSLSSSKEIAKLNLEHVILISESGLKSSLEIKELVTYGFQGFLIGEAFMKTADPKEACRKLLGEIHDLNILLKICGIKDSENLKELVGDFNKLGSYPSLIGFISHGKSKRFVSPGDCQSLLTLLPENVGAVLVTVDLEIAELEKYLSVCKFSHLQLHGSESPEYIGEVRNKYPKIKIIKAISIQEVLDLNHLRNLEPCVDLFLFDSAGPLKGGNGTKFPWESLANYQSDTPFFLSGGIRPEDLPSIREHFRLNEKMIGIDVNSGFEISPGVKDSSKIGKLIENLSNKEVKNEF